MSVNRKVIANYLASGWAALIGLASIPLYIRYLGIEAFGLIGFFATLQAWFLLLDMGLSQSISREMARFSVGAVPGRAIRDLLKSVAAVYAGVAVAIAVLIYGLSDVIAAYFLKADSLSRDEIAQAILLMGLVLSFQWMGTLYRSALLGLQQQVWLSVETALTATVRAAGTVLLLAYASPTLFAYFLFQCAVGAVESLALRWYLHRRLPLAVASPRFNVQALQSIWRFAAGLAAIAFLATLLTQVDKLLLAKMLTLEQFGYFTVAITLASALSVLIAPINNVAFPVLSEGVATGDTSSLASHYHKFAQLLSIGIFPLAIVLCLFSENILFLWTGVSGTAFAVAPLLSVWVIGTALNGLMHVPYAAQLAHGWSQLSLMLNTVAVLIMVPAMVFLVPRHGAIAAAWIWVAINVGYMVFGIAAMHRRILKKEKWKWYLQDVLGPLAASAFTAVGMSALHSKVQGLSRLEELCFLMAATAVLLFAATAAVPLGRQFLMSAANLVKERTACATDK